ncbi:AMP-binding protein [Aquihabitans sp. G128]|uniref:AMP-binding protein n=1 Tax=Aquihabitans sp. G128 TaxID=2849779 RepID=UPI001C22BF4E|nr:AMP-binding protein [Aquihabitans sp. G128]QXC59418.1 AMP-binding protein [Aquihabitans sp. G128]
MERHFATVWESVADVVPDEVAVVQGELRRTWRDLEDRAARLAGAFVAAGLAPGAKVAEYLYNSSEYLETYFAALKVRAVPVNVNYRYLDDELLYLLEDSEAEVLVFHASLADRVARVRERASRVRLWVQVDDDGSPLVDGAVAYDDVLVGHEPALRIERSPDDITMTYTGGTTGMPKGVMSRIGPGVDAILSSAPPIVGEAPVTDPADVAAFARRFADSDRRLVGLPACPLMHATGLSIGTFPSLTFGGTIVLLAGRGLDVDEVWDLVERERVLSLTIVGDPFARPLRRGLDEAAAAGRERDLSSLLIILSSGAMFSTEVKAGLCEHLPTVLVLDFIAATEGTMGTALSSKDVPAVTGRFSPGVGVKVFADGDREVAAGSGEGGMVGVPGAIPVGYFHDAAKTDKTFRDIDGVRYSFPGDWATVEADGSLTLLGRGSQCINTGGEKVFPEEVEEALKRHPAVEDSLVFGVDDERFGQRVVAVASMAPGIHPSALDGGGAAIIDSLRDHLSSYKLPRDLVLVDEVPRAPNGKADYPRARRLFADRT